MGDHSGCVPSHVAIIRSYPASKTTLSKHSRILSMFFDKKKHVVETR